MTDDTSHLVALALEDLGGAIIQAKDHVKAMQAKRVQSR